jgi:hypothetical protein
MRPGERAHFPSTRRQAHRFARPPGELPPPHAPERPSGEVPEEPRIHARAHHHHRLPRPTCRRHGRPRRSGRRHRGSGRWPPIQDLREDVVTGTERASLPPRRSLARCRPDEAVPRIPGCYLRDTWPNSCRTASGGVSPPLSPRHAATSPKSRRRYRATGRSGNGRRAGGVGPAALP